MAKESELTRRITRVVKASDKLVQDIQRDAGQILVAANRTKEVINSISMAGW